MCVKDNLEPIEDIEVGGETYQLKSVNFIDPNTGVYVKRQLMLFQNDKPVNIEVFHELSEREFALAQSNRQDLEIIIDYLIQRSLP